MIKFAYICDTHIYGKNIETRKDKSSETIFKKLELLIDFCVENRIKKIIHGGDLFESPNVSNSTIGKFAELFAKAHKKHGIMIYFVPGNHDMYGKNIDAYKTTPLYILEQYDWFKIISGKVISFKDCLLSGYHYTKELEYATDFYFPIFDKAESHKKKILIVHSMISSSEKDYVIDGNTYAVSYKNINTDADVLLYGHNHPGMKVKKVNTLEHDVCICNPGSFLRTTKYVEKHTVGPGIAVVKIDGNDVSVKRYNIECEKSVFKKETKDEQVVTVNHPAFINILKKFKKKNFSIDDIENIFRPMIGKKIDGVEFDITEKLVDMIVEKIRKNRR